MHALWQPTHIFLIVTLLWIGCAEDPSIGSDPECGQKITCTGDEADATPRNEDSQESGDSESNASSVDSEEGDIESAPDSASDGTLTEDSTTEDSAGSGPDASPADTTEEVDVTGPVVVSMDPEDGETQVGLPLSITLTFNEPVRVETVDTVTFIVRDPSGKSIGGSPVLSEDGTQVTLTPAASKVEWASPYTVEVSVFVQDLLGNPMNEEFEGVFYTGAPEGMETYAALATQYAPRVYQGVRLGNAHYDYPTAIDWDGDWDVANNKDALKSAQEVAPSLYWDAMETRSHLFLFYFLYYSIKDAPGEIAKPVSNDLTGIVVTLAKESDLASLRPVSVTTYGAYSGVEEMRVHKVEGEDLGNGNLVDATATWGQMAEEDAFKAYVSSPLHVACSWELGGDGECELNAGILLELNWLILAYTEGVPSLLIKDGTWPTEGDGIDYALIHSLPQLWARRTSFGPESLWQDTYSFDYGAAAERPGSGLSGLPSFFNPKEGNDAGRPPWAWKWKPGLTQFAELPRGTLYLDPAYFFQKRHGMEEFNWQSMSFTGWSLEYCFNGSLGIDKRDSFGECLPAEIP